MRRAGVKAAKAARLRLLAPGRLLLDFGLRRAHGAAAGLLQMRPAKRFRLRAVRIGELPGFAAATEADLLQAVQAHLSKARRLVLASAVQ